MYRRCHLILRMTQCSETKFDNKIDMKVFDLRVSVHCCRRICNERKFMCELLSQSTVTAVEQHRCIVSCVTVNNSLHSRIRQR